MRKHRKLAWVNQGWKDSWDSVSYRDGHLGEPPIALCEVQGYAYAAYRAMSYLGRTPRPARGSGTLDPNRR